MSRTLPLIILLPLLILGGCSGDKVSFGNKNDPACYFEEEFKNLRWIDLSKKISDSLVVERNGNQATIFFEYDRKSKQNTISHSALGVLASGHVTKYQDVYFINSMTDSVYQLYAFVYDKKKSIQGITELALQQASLYKSITSGYDDDLILKQNDKDFVLETDKKKLLKLYSTLLLESEPWNIQ